LLEPRYLDYSMRGTLMKALWLLLAMDLLVVANCPLAPALSMAPSHRQCQHERVPARDPHSCCVSVHHQPALVRPMLENTFALPAPASVSTLLAQAVQVSPIGMPALKPSPPLLFSELRI
jgi:hypothetical protein